MTQRHSSTIGPTAPNGSDAHFSSRALVKYASVLFLVSLIVFVGGTMVIELASMWSDVTTDIVFVNDNVHKTRLAYVTHCGDTRERMAVAQQKVCDQHLAVIADYEDRGATYLAIERMLIRRGFCGNGRDYCRDSLKHFGNHVVKWLIIGVISSVLLYVLFIIAVIRYLIPLFQTSQDAFSLPGGIKRD